MMDPVEMFSGLNVLVKKAASPLLNVGHILVPFRIATLIYGERITRPANESMAIVVIVRKIFSRILFLFMLFNHRDALYDAANHIKNQSNESQKEFPNESQDVHDEC